MPFKSFLPSIWRRSEHPMRRDEVNPLYALHREMNQMFDDFFRSFDFAPFSTFEERFRTFSPSVDIVENEKEVTVKVELPGMDEKDVDVLLTEDTLTIKGEKKEEKEDKGNDYYHMERTYGHFNRVIPLPREIDTANVEARFKNGILSITLPKWEVTKTKGTKVPIKVE